MTFCYPTSGGILTLDVLMLNFYPDCIHSTKFEDHEREFTFVIDNSGKLKFATTTTTAKKRNQILYREIEYKLSNEIYIRSQKRCYYVMGVSLLSVSRQNGFHQKTFLLADQLFFIFNTLIIGSE
jgi:hypothetical protein